MDDIIKLRALKKLKEEEEIKNRPSMEIMFNNLKNVLETNEELQNEIINYFGNETFSNFITLFYFDRNKDIYFTKCNVKKYNIPLQLSESNINFNYKYKSNILEGKLNNFILESELKNNDGLSIVYYIKLYMPNQMDKIIELRNKRIKPTTEIFNNIINILETDEKIQNEIITLFGNNTDNNINLYYYYSGNTIHSKLELPDIDPKKIFVSYEYESIILNGKLKDFIFKAEYNNKSYYINLYMPKSNIGLIRFILPSK